MGQIAAAEYHAAIANPAVAHSACAATIVTHAALRAAAAADADYGAAAFRAVAVDVPDMTLAAAADDVNWTHLDAVPMADARLYSCQ